MHAYLKYGKNRQMNKARFPLPEFTARVHGPSWYDAVRWAWVTTSAPPTSAAISYDDDDVSV